jgi:hypothetical protein
MKRLILFLMALVFLLEPAFGAEAKKPAVKAKNPTAVQEAKSPETTYHALIIGNNQYKYLPNLKTARNDAVEVEKLLKGKFNFQTELVLDATRANILGKINEIRKRLGEKDSLLIYYAGHGEYDKTVDKAFWLPVDSQRDDPTNWIIADDITSNIKRIDARHVLVISDSCYSGTLARQAITELITTGEREGYIKKMQERPSRTLMASGGNEPVSDSGGGNNSIFAAAFLKALKESDREVFTAEEIFHSRIKPIVAGKSDQVPEYSSIKNSGDEGGDFVFKLAKMEVETIKPIEVIKLPKKIESGSERPPTAEKFTLVDLEKKAEEEKADWNTNLKNMKIAFGKVEEYEKRDAAPDLKIEAWRRFLETFKDKNPFSDEDTRYRKRAEEQIKHWQVGKQALAAKLEEQRKPEAERERTTLGIALVPTRTSATEFSFAGPPAFTVTYPKGSTPTDKDSPVQVWAIKTPAGVIVQAAFAPIPEGVELKDAAAKGYLPGLAEAMRTKVKMGVNKEITLSDGTKAYYSEMDWIYNPTITRITTMIVSVYKDGKWVYTTAHPWENYGTLEKIVKSLKFK